MQLYIYIYKCNPPHVGLSEVSAHTLCIPARPSVTIIQVICGFVQPCKANEEYLETSLMAFIHFCYDKLVLNFIYYCETQLIYLIQYCMLNVSVVFSHLQVLKYTISNRNGCELKLLSQPYTLVHCEEDEGTV